jgi:hypothetical protein
MGPRFFFFWLGENKTSVIFNSIFEASWKENPIKVRVWWEYTAYLESRGGWEHLPSKKVYTRFVLPRLELYPP